jgi:two-component sensor histidine kinase
MIERSAGRKAMSTRKLKDEQNKSAPSTQQAKGKSATEQKIDSPEVQSRLEKAISELQSLNEVLLSGDLDPRVLADFRDAVNRVRTVAWAAHQYVVRKETDEGSSSVLALLVGERVRVTYQLCQSIREDLKLTDIEVPAGSLIQLYEVVSALAEQLKGAVNRLG